MGDRKSTKQPISHIKKHLKFTINSSQELKDEGYLQVIKQITLHPEYDKCLRGWKFLAIIHIIQRDVYHLFKINKNRYNKSYSLSYQYS